MVTFKAVRSGTGVFRDGAYVPPSNKNKDWREYLTFLSGGGQPLDPPGGTLAEERTAGKLRLDAAAKARSSAAIDAVGGPELSTLLEEARYTQEQITASGTIDETLVPMLTARMGASGETYDVASAAVLADYGTALAEWRKIEAARVTARDAVDAAGTAQEIDGIVTTVNWTKAVLPLSPSQAWPVGGK